MPHNTYPLVDSGTQRFYDSPHDLEGPIAMAERSFGHDYLLGRSLGHYRILEKVGEGGMGQVYRARDENLAREVAIKVLPPGTLADANARRRFQKEARSLSQLNHPNIATIFDFDTCDGVDFLVMELVDGQTLDIKLALCPLPESETAKLGTQLAEALVAAHRAGVIHRDVKPANLKLTKEGLLKMLDFGLARILRPVESESTTTSLIETSGAAGTLPYMAPEQLREETLDARTDIYGAGAVLYEMATGERPFPSTSGALLVDAILHQPPTPPSVLNYRISPRLQNIIVKCLQKDPENRYASAADLLVDLRALQRPETAPVAVPPRRWWRRALGAAAGLALVALLAAAIPSVREPLKRWLHLDSIPSVKLVAVLPFSVIGEDQQTSPFSDGLTETLTAKLTQLTLDPKLQVVPAPEIRAKGVKALDDARNEFGATLVFEGSMHRVADNLRINVALVDARTRVQLRAETLTVPASDPFAVQDKVVNAAVSMLDLDVEPSARQKLQAHGTKVATAYDLYLQGRGYLQNYDKLENVQKAVRVFTAALQLDQDYALAYAGRGDAYWQLYDANKQPQWIEASRQDCEQAARLDPDLPAAIVCLGTIAKGAGHYQEAATAFDRALEADKTNDHAYLELAETYELLGDAAQAEATYRRAIQLRPAYWAGYNWLGVFYYQHARYQQAADMFQKVLLRAPNNVRGMFNLAATYNSLGRYADAIALLQSSIALRPEALAYTNLGNAYFYLRRYDEATAAYKQATQLDAGDPLLWWNLGDGYYWGVQRPPAADAYQRAISLADNKLKINPKDASMLGILAICHAMRGERKPALDALQRALQFTPSDPDLLFKAALIHNHFGDGPETLAWLKKCLAAGFSASTVRDTPDFSSLNTDPHFQELIREK